MRCQRKSGFVGQEANESVLVHWSGHDRARDFIGQGAIEPAISLIKTRTSVIFIGQCVTKVKCRGRESNQQPPSLKHVCNENPSYQIHDRMAKLGIAAGARAPQTILPGARAVLGRLRKFCP